MAKSDVFFGETFFEDYASRLISNPDVALVELVANAWDAGASVVNITYPSSLGGLIVIEDDGTGMTKKQFHERWLTLNYNRIKIQGREVEFPDVKKARRIAYGCKGKGRHSMFCFNETYSISTTRDGTKYTVEIERSSGQYPWRLISGTTDASLGHGTVLQTKANKNLNSEFHVRQLLGSKFLADPDFRVSINGTEVDFEEIRDILAEFEVEIPTYGKIRIRKIKSIPGRTTLQHGVAYWVNNRLVGNPSWEGYDSTILDGRGRLAKSLTFIVMADILSPETDVEQDWSCLIKNAKTDELRRSVSAKILESIGEENKTIWKERKRNILSQNKSDMTRLPILSKERVALFIDHIQEKCPAITDDILEDTVKTLINLENSESGYNLISQLSNLPPDHLDQWNDIIEKWTADDAKKVLDELGRRLLLIEQLENLIEKSTTDELHDLQPIFEKGLWIFGPEYEAIEFRSNRWLSTVIKDFFGTKVIDDPRRPDFVILPDSSIGSYACDSYDNDGNVNGLDKVIIIELKKGGFKISTKETNQAKDYALEIKRSGKANPAKQIVCFVLGAIIDEDSHEPIEQGNIRVIARPYSIVLRQAHARTFNLHQQLQMSAKTRFNDSELADVLAQTEMFNTR